MKNKSMLLIEIYHYGSDDMFKRRISESYDSLQDWLNNNADKWAEGKVVVDCDDFCFGTICYNDNPLYIFETHNIALV